MYRLLIVDDEHHIVNWLAFLFENQSDLELEINKCYSGREALSILGKRKMDIIFMDIQMPGMDGLQAGEKICMQYPFSYIIFLTGYHDFSYIYQASQLEHISYLLKSEDNERIIQELKSCIGKIENDRKNIQLNQQNMDHELFTKHLFQSDLLKELLTGKSIAEIRHLFNASGTEKTVDFSRNIRVIYIKTFADSWKNSDFGHPSLCHKIPLLIASCLNLQGSFAIIPANEYTFLGLFQLDSEENPVFHLKSLAEDFLALWTEKFSWSCTMLICTDSLTWDELPHLNLRFAEYIPQKYVSVSPKASCFSLVSKTELPDLSGAQKGIRPDLTISEPLLNNLENYLYQNDKDGYFSVFYKLTALICSEKSMHSFSALEIYMKIASTLIGCINQHSLQQRLALHINLYSLYYISNFKTWKEGCLYLEKLSKCLFQELSDQEIDRKQELVFKIRHYIQNHLSADLSLSNLAERFNYNSSYLSYLFKQTTGIGLSDHITEVRIDRANYLLANSSDSISAIAEQTGFDTAQYFSYVYKRRMGITPSEYRINHKSPV